MTSQRLLKGDLPTDVSHEWLRNQRAHYEGFADIFEAMASQITDPHYLYIIRVPERKSCAREVSKAARNLAQYFESVWRGKQPYSMTTTAGKLNTLIIKLSNLDAT